MGVPGPSNSNPLKLSAYADYIIVLVIDREDIRALEDSLRVYEGASTLRVNWGGG